MPPPRRKSCLSCVRSKRRCDLGTPACDRCKSKGIVCDYGGIPPSKGNEDDVSTLQLQQTLGTWDIEQPFPEETRIGINFDSNQGTGLSTPDLQIPSLSDGTISWSDLMTDIDDFMVPDSVWDHPRVGGRITEGAIYQARTVYAMKQLKTWPKLFIERGQTPFIHRHLFQEGLPAPLMDAMSAGALYCGKNDENESLVFQDISQKAATLIENKEAWRSPTEQLASVQALILYNIIRLFDGNIRVRADAELSEPLLICWTEQLKTRLQSLALANTFPVQPATADWYGWIYAESVRRTVLVSLMLRGIYMFLKQGWDDVEPEVNPLSFTAQASLWNASSEFLWQEAWNEKNHFSVTVGRWDESMNDASSSDLDELGIMMLAIIKGMDALMAKLSASERAKYGIDWKPHSITDSRSLTTSTNSSGS